MTNKEVRFTGYAAVPSDYDCPDGQLAQAYNLLNETGSMQPLFPPKKLRVLHPQTGKCIGLHKAGGQKWLIMWYPMPNDGLIRILSLDGEDLPTALVSGFHIEPKVAILGNTLTVSNGEKTSFIVYSEDEGCHKYLGDKIPEISISLALGHNSPADDSHSDTVTLGIPDNYSAEDIAAFLTEFTLSGGRRAVGNVSRVDADAFSLAISDAVIGFLNKMSTDAADENKFMHPFLVRWALRMHDGSYIHQSAPVLMVPNSGMPVLKYIVTSKKPLVKLALTCLMRRCTLMFRPSGLSALGKWTDFIKSIDFFATLPIYTYDQAGEVSSTAHRSTNQTVFSHSGTYTSAIATASVLSDSPEEIIENEEVEGESGPALQSDSYGVQTQAFGDNNENNHRVAHVSSLKDAPLYNFTDNVEAKATTGSPALVPPAFSREHIESAITSASQFYLLASLPITGKDAVTDLDAFTPLDLNDVALSSLAARPTLPDDWRSHDQIHFHSAYSYNSRLAFANISSSLFPGFSLSDMGQFWDYTSRVTVPQQATIWVKLIRNFKSYWVSSVSPIKLDHIPRYLYYPDPSAVEMRIILSDGSGWKLPLKTHDFLNGAYWFDGLSSERTPKESSVEVPVSEGTIANEPNKLFLSEVNNPLFFPVENRNNVGSGTILGISSAAKALSQGQFGQFPLYAFTDEGVWALEVSASGGFSAKQPITRDVCIQPGAIAQIDSAVLFPTDRGVMLISGSQSQCITDVLNSPYCFSFSSLPGLHELFPNIPFPDCLFTEYITNCHIAYDYLNQRILVYNPLKSYAYVYSMKSKLWGLQQCKLTTPLNSYPDSLCMQKESGRFALVDISQTDDESVQCLLVSRPLKFDSPDVLKTVATVIQRGLLPRSKTEISTILYATRDYVHWHLVSSSRGIAIHSFLGTPFKAFRVVSAATLGPSHSLSGCSFSVMPRFTNRLR